MTLTLTYENLYTSGACFDALDMWKRIEPTSDQQILDWCNEHQTDWAVWIVRFIDKKFERMVDWSKLSAWDWAFLLTYEPWAGDKCKIWDRFSGDDWVWLLKHQPKFADKCKWWGDFSQEEQFELLAVQPHLREYFA